MYTCTVIDMIARGEHRAWGPRDVSLSRSFYYGLSLAGSHIHENERRGTQINPHGGMWLVSWIQTHAVYEFSVFTTLSLSLSQGYWSDKDKEIVVRMEQPLSFQHPSQTYTSLFLHIKTNKKKRGPWAFIGPKHFVFAEIFKKARPTISNRSSVAYVILLVYKKNKRGKFSKLKCDTSLCVIKE